MKTARFLATLALAAALCLAAATGSQATVYYVDFDGGADSANGRSPEAAWKHSPDDSAASGVAGATNLAAGDTVIFKGGVHYRGAIVCERSGAAGQPITYDGNTAGTFGTGRAVIDGSERITGWTQCQSAADCGGNPNWQNLWHSTVPAGTDVFIANMYEDNLMLWPAQDPNLTDPFFADDLSTFRSVPTSAVTQTSLVDAAYFNQPNADYWDNAYILLWVNPNVVVTRKILSYVPAEHKVTFASATVYTDRNTLYATSNHLLKLDVPGELVVSEASEPDGSRRIWFWPRTAGDPNQKQVTRSVRRTGINLAGRDYITVQGFRMQKHTAGFEEWRVGNAVLTYSGGSHLVIRDNEMTANRSMERQGVIRMYGGCSYVTIEDNYVYENPRNRGAILTFDDSAYRNNRMRKNGGTAIDFYGCRRSEMVGNTVTENTGVHANGLTLYLGCDNCLVAYNTVFDGNCALTLQDGTNFTVAYNVLHTDLDTYTATDWGRCDGINYYNNVMINRYGKSLAKGSTTTNVVVRNNILDGSGAGYGTNVSHNIYTSLMWNQDPRYGWSLGVGEIIQRDKTLIFLDPVNRDFRLIEGSPAIDAGIDLGLTRDRDGAVVPQGAGPDIGAYEYGGEGLGAHITGWSVVVAHGGTEITSAVSENYVEPRVRGLQKLLVAFSGPLDPATVATGVVGISGDTSGDLSTLVQAVTLSGGDTLVIELTGPLPDRERFTLAVSDALLDAAGEPVSGDLDVRLAALAGDVNASGRVTAADVLATRSQATATVTPANASLDVDCSGRISGADMLAVQHRLGAALP